MNSNGLNTNQIMILVIALLMLTSTIGFSLYFSDPSTSAPPIDDPILNQPPATQQIALSAERVEGIIERVLPQMRIAGFTLNNNIEEIDQELRTLPGILRVSNSQLTIDSSGQLLYLGEMEFDPSLDTVGVATQIAETATQLTQLQVVSRVLVRLPDVVQATNAELNITKDYSLSPPYTETYAQLIFSEGDTVLVNLDLAVVNNQVSITGALVVEEALVERSFSSLTNIRVTELSDSIVFSGTVVYDGFDMNAIEKNIVDALPDANSAKVRVVFGDNPIRVGLSVVDESDINGILLAASSIGNFQGSELLPQDDGRTVVALEFFGGGLEYAPIKKLLLEDLEKKGFRKVRDFIFIDGSADLFGEVYLTTTDASDSVLALRKLLTEQYGFPFGAVAIHQVASVEALDPFFDESTNRNFTFAKPFTGLLLAGNVVGGEFVVPVAVEVVGGVVITAQAIEGSNQSLSTFWAKDEEGNLIPVGSLGTHGEEVTRADTE